MPNYNTFPTYGNYSAYPNSSYQQQYAQAYQPQYNMPQSNTSYAVQQQPVGIAWVDGEIGAKAYQLPANWPVNAPMPLWDTNDTIIYLKSTNQMGMPNPIQKVRYIMEETPRMAPAMSGQPALPAGDNAQQMPDMSEYVRKDELEQMKEELKSAITATQQETKVGKANGKSAV